jgi:hypothetical protein
MVIHWLIKWKSAVCNAKRNRRVHGKLILWYVCGLLRQRYYGSFEKGYTFKWIAEYSLKQWLKTQLHKNYDFFVSTTRLHVRERLYWTFQMNLIKIRPFLMVRFLRLFYIFLPFFFSCLNSHVPSLTVRVLRIILKLSVVVLGRF